MVDAVLSMTSSNAEGNMILFSREYSYQEKSAPILDAGGNTVGIQLPQPVL